MVKKGHKAGKIIIFVFILLIIGGFALNWYLTYRLQSKLNKILSEEVTEVTDGFYRFSFEDLKVGFFSGELSIKGIELKPDSLVFHQWQQGDSLPNVYYDIHIGEIHFKGINLTWLSNYRKLDFSLFEIRDPDIKIFDPQNKTKSGQKIENKELGTLYEIVSPYIKILTVSRMNLINANVSYVVEDKISPVIYALKEADFRAYNFRLDEDSSESGKLLYCDHFEFIADSPQELLNSDQIIFKTTNIKLSTLESLIHIEGVRISPKDSYWDKRMENGGGFLYTNINAVDVTGVTFDRQKGKNYLEADLFSIYSTDIKYLTINNENPNSEQDPIKQQSGDSVISHDTWSLYNVLSPILHSISIHKINVEKTRFNYTITQNGYTDVYTLGQFDFHANNFLIDSLSEKQKRFWYVDDFIMTGSDVNGLIASNNADVSIAYLRLNTTDKQFNVSDIKLNPINPSFKKDYISGQIKGINVNGLEYNSGVSANQLELESPNIEYFRSGKEKAGLPSKGSQNIAANIFDILSPYTDFLSVKRIDLSNGDIVIHDVRENDIYRLKRLNFYATDFLFDEQTKQCSGYPFSFDDIGLSFKDFDNVLPERNYRLQIKDVNLSSITGKIAFKALKLLPLKEKGRKAPDIYYTVEIPSFEVVGFDYDRYMKRKEFEVRSISLESPYISAVRANQPIKTVANQSNLMQDLSQVLTNMKIEQINVDNVRFSYRDQALADTLQIAFQRFHLNQLEWDVDESLRLEEISLNAPVINYMSVKAKEGSYSAPTSSLIEEMCNFASALDIHKVSITDGEVNIEQPHVSMNSSIKLFGLSGFDWKVGSGKSNLKLGTVNINDPSFNLNRKMKSSDNNGREKGDLSRDFYSVLKPYVNTLSVDKLGILDADIDYSYLQKEKKDQILNATNLSIEGLKLNIDDRKVDIEDLHFTTNDLRFPIMDEFYTMAIGGVDIRKKAGIFSLSDVRVIPAYPKREFAYIHPKHKDWFDVRVKNVALSGIDYPTYFSKNILNVNKLKVSDIQLQNFKNQQIEIQHNIMPLIYEKIQYLPIKFSIDTTDISRFSVMYEELPKNGAVSGKIHFDKMNGRIANLTNIASYPQQYMVLDADGYFMGDGHFKAKWHIPVSPDHDCFILEAAIDSFNLKSLNDIFIPLAKAEVKSGVLTGFNFRTEASSKQAKANMLMLYNDLSLNVLKGDSTERKNKLLSSVANAMIRSNNPNKRNGKPREANIEIERDPYHSTFNYFWQILQPAIAESAGVSQGTQNFAKKVGSFFSKVKGLFSRKNADSKEPTSDEEE